MLYTILNAKKLNLGSGADIRTGWVNLDIGNITGVDIVHDIEKLPLPFDDDRFEEILCNDILEHINYIPVLKDVHRILAPGGYSTLYHTSPPKVMRLIRKHPVNNAEMMP